MALIYHHFLVLTESKPILRQDRGMDDMDSLPSNKSSIDDDDKETKSSEITTQKEVNNYYT